MKAHDVMTREVATVGPETPASEIAKLLLQKEISAVPVVDRSGAPIGMVSEGDLIGRDEAARVARRDWWLALLAEGTELSDEFLKSLSSPKELARDILSAPVVTVDEETDVREIARLLSAHRIKRVPVLRDGRIVGIVSRADLLRALAGEDGEIPPTEGRAPAPRRRSGVTQWMEHVEERFLHERSARGSPSPQPAAKGAEEPLSAGDFRALVADFERREAEHEDETRRAAAEKRRQRAKELIDRHLSEEDWRALVQEARQAAESGEREHMLLRFPSRLLSDGGRAVNAPLPDWQKTLRGEAAEIYLRWERDLKPAGFGLSARVLDFPGGMPGDVGLFLLWGE